MINSVHDGTIGGRTRPPFRLVFSLFELVIVLAIMGVLAGIAVPRYGSAIERYRAETAARRLVADLGHARHQAISTSSSRTVVFRPSDESYVLLGVPDLKTGAVPYTISVGDAPYQTDLVSATFDVLTDAADAVNMVIFNGHGVPDSGGTAVLNCGSTTRTVVLDADTGKAAVQ